MLSNCNSNYNKFIYNTIASVMYDGTYSTWYKGVFNEAYSSSDTVGAYQVVVIDASKIKITKGSGTERYPYIAELI